MIVDYYQDVDEHGWNGFFGEIPASRRFGGLALAGVWFEVGLVDEFLGECNLRERGAMP